MATFRFLHTDFWRDNFFVELTPEDKYFYIYLLTNDRCTQCGIYDFGVKYAAAELGYSVDTVKTLLTRFIDYGKILYDEKNGDIMILNWYKYNMNLNNKNSRVCINTCLKKVKTLRFIKNLYYLCSQTYKNEINLVNELFIGVSFSEYRDSLSIIERDNDQSIDSCPSDDEFVPENSEDTPSCIEENPEDLVDKTNELVSFCGKDVDKSKETLEESFTLAVKDGLNKFLEDYSIELRYEQNTFVSSMFNSFLTNVRYKIDRPIYVLIDEYDHFANELLSFQPDLFPEILSKTERNVNETPQLSLMRAQNYGAEAPRFVRQWYEVLKIGTQGVVSKIFATGVSPIALDSLTSGFNIADDITRNEEFNEMMGFTRDEVLEIIDKSVSKELSQDELSNLMYILQNNYNGYLFSERCETRLFNSDMILYYMKSFSKNGMPPINLIDKNIASDYGKLGKLFELKNRNANTEVLEQILRGELLKCRLTESFSLEKRFTKDDFKSLLFYLGLLTIDSSDLGRVVLKVPNYAIRGLYFEYFASKVDEFTDYELDTSDIEDGYIDIALLKQPNINPKYFAIFELKYISKKEYEEKGDSIIKSNLKDAIDQLNKYTQSNELSSISNLKKWALIFVNDKCVVNQLL